MSKSLANGKCEYGLLTDNVISCRMVKHEFCIVYSLDLTKKCTCIGLTIILSVVKYNYELRQKVHTIIYAYNRFQLAVFFKNYIWVK